jgi:hypothetical protein
VTFGSGNDSKDSGQLTTKQVVESGGQILDNIVLSYTNFQDYSASIIG